MKKVWVLEKFISPEDIIASMSEIKSMIKADSTPDQVCVAREMLGIHSDKLLHNPNGYWCGWAGKTIYKQFCNEAKESISCNPNAKYRVVEAEIEDDAKTWLGYKPVKENTGVLRYLMATYKYA